MPAKRKTKKTTKRTVRKKTPPKRSYTKKSPIGIQVHKPLQTTRPRRNKGGSQALSIIGLILNLAILPGLGTIVGGRIKEGIWQIVLLLGSIILGLLLTLTAIGAIIGVPIIILGPAVIWIWALISGIKMIQEAFN